MAYNLSYPCQPDYGAVDRHDDTAFLGRVGEIELGASALAGVYYMIIFI